MKRRVHLTHVQLALRALRTADTSYSFALSLEPQSPAQRAAIIAARVLPQTAISDAERLVQGQRGAR